MGETLAETRLEVDAEKAEIERAADQLRAALDLKARFRQNPALVVGLGAGALFLLAGGPIRLARFARRRLMRSTPEKAYDTLPRPLQAWVDQMAGAVGPRAVEARQALSEELLRWRHDPRRHRKVSKKLAKEIAEGPPGPTRAAWRALEAGATILTAALARKAVERFLSGEVPAAPQPDTMGTESAVGEDRATTAKPDRTRRQAPRAGAPAPPGNGYSSLSKRSRGTDR